MITATQNTAAPVTTTTTSPTTVSDDTKPSIVVPEGSLTADQAKAVAMGLFPELTVTKVETELEHGVLVYEVKFSDGSEVTILASDGSVIANESHKGEKEHSRNSHATSKHNEGNHFGQLKHDD
jgi:uncharacterized membrane protein YkoI